MICFKILFISGAVVLVAIAHFSFLERVISESIVNNPHALYCNGELVGIILNLDSVPGGAGTLLDGLNDVDPDVGFDMITIPINDYFYEWGMLREALRALKVKSEIEVEKDEDDV